MMRDVFPSEMLSAIEDFQFEPQKRNTIAWSGPIVRRQSDFHGLCSNYPDSLGVFCLESVPARIIDEACCQDIS